MGLSAHVPLTRSVRSFITCSEDMTCGETAAMSVVGWWRCVWVVVRAATQVAARPLVVPGVSAAGGTEGGGAAGGAGGSVYPGAGAVYLCDLDLLHTHVAEACLLLLLLVAIRPGVECLATTGSCG